jgi:hypothetical protein
LSADWEVNVVTNSWFGVRTIYWWESEHKYEERITTWFAPDFRAAIDKAEVEAMSYEDENIKYLDFAQGYLIADPTETPVILSEAVEVFSLVRVSDLDPDDYIATFFDKGLLPHVEY